MSDEATTFTMSLAGRKIEFRKPHLGQILILQRIAQRSIAQARDRGDDAALAAAMQESLMKTLNFIDTLFVDEKDRQFVEDEMLAGNIDYKDVLKTLSGGVGQDQPQDDAPPAKKTVAKRSPKAAPVKKSAAPRARTKR